MPLDDADYRLSGKISRRSPTLPDPPGLRTLMVHRLSDSFKAILRRALHSHEISVFCEACEKWTHSKTLPGEWHCTTCDRRYRVEFVIYEEIENE